MKKSIYIDKQQLFFIVHDIYFWTDLNGIKMPQSTNRHKNTKLLYFVVQIQACLLFLQHKNYPGNISFFYNKKLTYGIYNLFQCNTKY